MRKQFPGMKGFVVLAAIVVMSLGGTIPLQAQMFSVGSERSRLNIPQTEVYVGFETMDVTYKGGSDVSPGQAGVFEFNGSILRLGYNGPGVDLFMGTGGEITGIDGSSYFDIGGELDVGWDIYRSPRFAVKLPVRIGFRYTNITDNEAIRLPTVNRFRFGSLTFGAGASLFARPADNFRMEAGAVPAYGFSFSDGGLFGGSLGSVMAFGRVYFDRLFGDTGLSLGYLYDLRNYDIDEDAYDYKINGHSFTVGVTF